jgi:hypothetical protein
MLASSARAAPSRALAVRRAPTLVIMATGTAAERRKLQPALDALCATFEADTRSFSDVIRLSVDTDLTAILSELTPGDARAHKGAFVRHLQDGIQARAFQSCRFRRTPVTLVEPLEVTMFSISYDVEAEANVSVRRYEVTEQELAPLDHPYNAHLNLFFDLDAFGKCVGRRFWEGGLIDSGNCRRFQPPSDAPPPMVSRPGPEPPTYVQGGPGRRIPAKVPLIVGGGGLLAAGAGVALYASGVSSLHAIQGDADAGRPYDENNGGFATRANAGTALMVAGGLAMATALALYLLNRRTGER